MARLFSVLFLLALTGLSTPSQAQFPGSGGYGGSPPSPPAVPYWQDQTTREGTASFTSSSGQSMTRDWNAPDVTDVEQNQVVHANQTASLTTSGKFHVKFKWIPTAANEPAPKNVIIGVLSHTDWSGPGGRGTTGSAQNGLGTQQTVATDWSAGDATATKYYVKDGSSGTIAFDISVSSTVNAAGQAVSGYAAQYISDPVRASKSLFPTIYTVKISLNGVTLDASGNCNILIGQGCFAAVTSTPLLPSDVTLHAYKWTISGDTFKSYVAHGIHTGSYAEVAYLNDLDLGQPNPHWYWRQGGGTHLSIWQGVSANADVYDHDVMISAVSDFKGVKVWNPTFSCTPKAGTVQLFIGGTFGQAIMIGAEGQA